MKISLEQLRRYVEIDVAPEELCDRMVMAGFEVEEAINLADTMRNVVVGKILSITPHENSDHLQICMLDVGTAEPVQIVTGADNVFVDAYVPAALHDSLLPNGMHIKSGKLRGVVSNGMLCSGEELKLSEDEYAGASVHGILILHGTPAPGTDMRTLLGLDDWIIDFKITANRPDCQSVLGVAREIAVVLKKEFKPPVPVYKTVKENIADSISVEVRDYTLCPRYIGRLVKNLKIAPSPDWMCRSLRAAGMRPINNIVDITNFVMLETGQPLHAFDYRDISGKQIIVRRAVENEGITTLDGKSYTLTPEMLVIADANAPSCLAGIMGGLNSEIKPDTQTLFLESAKFKRDNIRRTSRALGVRTESSGRYERGLDIMNTEYASNRALQLIDELGAGDIVETAIDCNDGLPAPRDLSVTVAGINGLLGLQIPGETMCEIMNSLHVPTTLTDGVLHCSVPSFRDDIECMADVAEEVMRIFGYDHIIGTPLRGQISRGSLTPERRADNRIKSLLCANGMYEISTYSFISKNAIDTLSLVADDDRRREISILNPLGDEYAVMRTQLATSMLSVLSTNMNRKNAAARLFEISKRFMPKQLPVTEQPYELRTMALGLYGETESFLTLKGIVEQLMELFDASVEYTVSEEPYLHPGRQAKVLFNGETVAVLGEVHPKTAEICGLNQRAYFAEVYLDRLPVSGKPLVLYRPLPKFPAVSRDLALLCDSTLPVGRMMDTIKKAGGKLLEQVSLFDVYEGKQIPDGKKSVAFNLTLRSAENTLTDEQIEAVVAKIIDKLQKIGAMLRS